MTKFVGTISSQSLEFSNKDFKLVTTFHDAEGKINSNGTVTVFCNLSSDYQCALVFACTLAFRGQKYGFESQLCKSCTTRSFGRLFSLSPQVTLLISFTTHASCVFRKYAPKDHLCARHDCWLPRRQMQLAHHECCWNHALKSIFKCVIQLQNVSVILLKQIAVFWLCV